MSAAAGSGRAANAMTESILLVEDDLRLAEMIRQYLGEAGYAVAHAATGRDGLAAHARQAADAIVLDLMLPDMNGLDVCRAIRDRSGTPILMLTARGDPLDRVVGLELGADDYLPKPFEPRELLARLRAILRRGTAGRMAPPTRFGRLEIDADARQVRIDETPVALTSYQFALLMALANRAGRVVSRDTLLDILKGEEFEAFDRSIDVHVSRIRAAIEDDPKHPRRIITVRGTGYLFAKAQD